MQNLEKIAIAISIVTIVLSCVVWVGIFTGVHPPVWVSTLNMIGYCAVVRVLYLLEIVPGHALRALPGGKWVNMGKIGHARQVVRDQSRGR